MGAEQTYSLVRLNSVDALQKYANAWDDLWYRSAVAFPGTRAGALAAWLEAFSETNSLRAVAVERNGVLLAAVPIYTRKIRQLVNVGTLPNNGWAICGDLLVDPTCDVEAVNDLLVLGLRQIRVPLLVLNIVPFEQPHWARLIESFKGSKLNIDVRELWQVGYVEIGQDWTSYEQSLSRNHRHSRRKQAKRLEREGGGQLRIYSDLSPSDLVPVLKRGFEVEDRSWKGERESSVLRASGIYDYYCREAAYLAEHGHLELVFLEHRGVPIAFLYGFQAKGIVYVMKVGYDEDYARFGPGHQLLMRYLQELHHGQQYQVLDFLGPLAPWTENWATRTYPVGRVVMSTTHASSPFFFQLYKVAAAARLPVRRELARVRRWIRQIRSILPRRDVSAPAPPESGS